MQAHELRHIRLFSELDETKLELLARELSREEFADEATILHQGGATRALYFICSGTVRVVLTSTSGEKHRLAELGPGEMFGERALLTGERRTADVIANSKVTLARLPRENFEHLLRHSPEISSRLSRELARQLGSWAERHQRDEQESRDILTNMVNWQLLPEFASFPGKSTWVHAFNARLEALGRGENNALLIGEAGVWKDLAARLIHYHSGDPARPVLFLDCAEPPPVLRTASRTARKPTRDDLSLEIAQESALFGHAPDSAIYAQGTRRGMLELADRGDLILRNLEHLSPRVQKRLADFLSRGSLRRCGEQQEIGARVRILATSSVTRSALYSGTALNAELRHHFHNQVLEIVPLRERKQDIPAIARHLLVGLNRKHHKQIHGLTPEALNLLLDHPWPLNGSELNQVLNRAVVMCRSTRIGVEHIYLQGHALNEGRFNLFNLPLIDRLARRPQLASNLRIAISLAFLSVLTYTLIGPEKDNVANLAVWSLWWPGLLLATALSARSWCNVCPLANLARFGKLTRLTHLCTPDWLIRWGPRLSLLALVTILIAEQASGMFTLAPATGLLLLTLLGIALACELLLGSRSWCRHLCPLGRMIGLGARLSLLEMRSNPNVCISRCRVDDCIKERACPMGLHPTGVNNSDDCILCFSCVRHCPHHSMHLDLRNPTQGVLTRPRRRFSEALFIVSLVGTSLAVKAIPAFDSSPSPKSGSMLWSAQQWVDAFMLIAGFILLPMLCSVGSRGHRWRATFAICGQAYLPLAVTGLFMIYFRVLIERGGEILPLLATDLGLEKWISPHLLYIELGTLRLLTVPILAAGFGFAWMLLKRLQQQYAINRLGAIGHRLLFTLTTFGYLVFI